MENTQATETLEGAADRSHEELEAQHKNLTELDKVARSLHDRILRDLKTIEKEIHEIATRKGEIVERLVAIYAQHTGNEPRKRSKK